MYLLIALAFGLSVGILVYVLGSIRRKRVGGLHFYQVGRYGATFYRKQVIVPAPTPAKAITAEIRGMLAEQYDQRGYPA